MASELIERELYGGRFHIVHNPQAKGNQPRYVVTDTESVKSKPKGVTTILGDTLAKDFVSWAVNCMSEVLLEKIEKGITEDDINEASREYLNRRGKGADTGTEAHALVETFLKGIAKGEHVVTATNPSSSSEADKAFQAFVTWFKRATPTILNVEEVIYSEVFQYAGTYDCMLEIDGKNYLCDLKTTNTSRKAPNGVYADMFLQLGAYAAAHGEQRAYELENGGTSLPEIHDLMVISAKKNGKLDIVTASELGLTVELCVELFYRVVDIWRFQKEVTKKLGGS